MAKYRFIARENIMGINDDLGLKALDGYGEIIVNVPDDNITSDILDNAIKQLNEKYPGRHFAKYDFKKINENEG